MYPNFWRLCFDTYLTNRSVKFWLKIKWKLFGCSYLCRTLQWSAQDIVALTHYCCTHPKCLLAFWEALACWLKNTNLSRHVNLDCKDKINPYSYPQRVVFLQLPAGQNLPQAHIGSTTAARLQTGTFRILKMCLSIKVQDSQNKDKPWMNTPKRFY